MAVNVFINETAFPFHSATDKCWNRYMVSL